MKSSTASSTGTGFFPGSGADSGSTSGSANTDADTGSDTAAGSSGGAPGGTSGETSKGYGPGGPLGVDSVWTSPLVEAPEYQTDSRDSKAGFPDPWFRDSDARVRSGEEASALTGRVAVTAMVALDSGQTLGVLKDLGRLRSWVDAQEAKAVTHLHDLTGEEHPYVGDPGRIRALAAAEIAAATKVPEVTAGILIDHSDLLTRDFPTTLAALEEGSLSKRHAWAVVEEAISIPDTVPAVLNVFESALITMAVKTTVRKFSGQAQRLREILHPESITDRHRKAVQDRRVYLNPQRDGMARFEAYLAVEDAAGIFHRVDTAARKLQGPDEPRTLTQLRADVLVDVLTSAGPTGHMTDSHPTIGSEPVEDVDSGPGFAGPESTTGSAESESAIPGSASGANEDAETNSRTRGEQNGGANGGPLAGAKEGVTAGSGNSPRRGSSGSGSNSVTGSGSGRKSGGGNGRSRDSDAYWGVQARVFVTVPVTTLLGGDEPGELEGYGPIDPETARKLAGHAPSFTRILTHPHTGARLGADATTYRVPRDLQDAVRARDRTWRQPGCNILAVFCELDHTIPWSQGGKTTYGNLACLCKRHHMFKTEGYWHYSQPESGTIIAISPAGETYLTTPDPPPSGLRPEIPPPF